MTLFSSNSLRLATFFTQTRRQLPYLFEKLLKMTRPSFGRSTNASRLIAPYIVQLFPTAYTDLLATLLTIWPRWRPNSFNGQRQRTFIVNASITNDRMNSNKANAICSHPIYVLGRKSLIQNPSNRQHIVISCDSRTNLYRVYAFMWISLLILARRILSSWRSSTCVW